MPVYQKILKHKNRQTRQREKKKAAVLKKKEDARDQEISNSRQQLKIAQEKKLMHLSWVAS